MKPEFSLQRSSWNRARWNTAKRLTARAETLAFRVFARVTQLNVPPQLFPGFRAFAFALLVLPLISGARASGEQSSVPPTLAQIQAAPARAATPALTGKEVRAGALREASLSYGARAGLARRSYEIRVSLDAAAKNLDAVWNFRPLMLPNNVLPPVLSEVNRPFKQSGDDLIRIPDKIYRITSQARFVSAQPNWRQYLVRDYGQVAEPPPAALLPRDDSEKQNWDAWLAEGWTQGVAQADRIFERDLNRLKQDFAGMILYRQLLSNKMVSLPFVASSNMGVTGDADSLVINDVVLRITALPTFNRNPQEWLPNPTR